MSLGSVAPNSSNLLNIFQILTSFLNEFPFWKTKKVIEIKHFKNLNKGFFVLLYS